MWMLEILHFCIWSVLFLLLYLWDQLYLTIIVSFNRAIRFKGYQQQDSQELLRYLLDGMRAEEIQVSVSFIVAYNFLLQIKSFISAKGRECVLSEGGQPFVKWFVLPISTYLQRFDNRAVEQLRQQPLSSTVVKRPSWVLLL